MEEELVVFNYFLFRFAENSSGKYLDAIQFQSEHGRVIPALEQLLHVFFLPLVMLVQPVYQFEELQPESGGSELHARETMPKF